MALRCNLTNLFSWWFEWALLSLFSINTKKMKKEWKSYTLLLD